MSRKTHLFVDIHSPGRFPGTRVSARPVCAALLFAAAFAASTAFAEPRLREEARSVEVDQPFDVTLTQQSGTGASWIVRDLAGVAVTGKDVVPHATMPGGSRQVIFHLVARETGDHVLEWNLIGATPGTVFEIYRLALHVERRSQ